MVLHERLGESQRQAHRGVPRPRVKKIWDTAEDVLDKPDRNPNRGDTMTTYETDQPRLQIPG